MYYTKKSKEAQLHHLISSFILLFVLIISSSIVTNTHIVYGQTNQTIAKNEDLLNIQDIPLKKVHVGDIDVAYKMFGKGDPIILFSGASDNMDAWDPSLLKGISSNHTVIVFDQRGIGNTTAGSRPYTPQQLADDTAGLLDALKIPKADVLGYSLGSYLAQQLTIMYPNKVNSLVLIGSSCGGKDHTPKPPEFLELQSEIVNNSLHNIPMTQEETKSMVTASLGSGWIRLHPESLEGFENITTFQQLKPAVNPEMVNNQNNVGKHWEDNPNWSGACDELAKLAKPTLVITGTDDNNYMPHGNALILASKIPGAWLVQIKNAGHAVMNQYPEEIGKILNTFLSTASQNR
ncbi:MAG: alpha/beta fold hydrolase [Nitrososphaeraceae archaeon]